MNLPVCPSFRRVFPHPLILLTLACTAVGAAIATPEWENGPSLPRGLAGHAAAAQRDGTLWIAGGSRWDDESKHILSEVWRLRPGDSTWHPAPPLPGGFAHGGFASDGRSLWLVGGFEAEGPSAQLRRINLSTGKPSTLLSLPEPRAYCGAALLDGSLWIVGGTPKDGDYANSPTTVYRFEVATGVLRRMPSAGPAMINPVVLALGGELHVLPGSVWSKKRRRLEAPAELFVYTPATDRWIHRPLSHALPRGLSGVALDSRHALLTGGVNVRDGAAEIDRRSWIYDSKDHSFSPAPPLPGPRLAAALATDGAVVWLLGGEDRPRSRVDSTWWLTVPPMPSP